jgi:hypothetical protein
MDGERSVFAHHRIPRLQIRVHPYLGSTEALPGGVVDGAAQVGDGGALVAFSSVPFGPPVVCVCALIWIRSSHGHGFLGAFFDWNCFLFFLGGFFSDFYT